MLVVNYSEWRASRFSELLSSDQTMACPACDGAGERTDECPCCGAESESSCDICDGDGEVNVTDLSRHYSHRQLMKIMDKHTNLRAYLSVVMNDVKAYCVWTRQCFLDRASDVFRQLKEDGHE